jgi:superfamily II DNA/RNA helicase
VRVEVSRAATTADNITQTLVPSESAPEEKRSTLRRIIRNASNFKNALIFCNRKRDVQVVYRSLQKHGFSVLALHGDLDQRMRTAALDAFRAGDVQLLVCSDVAARGLDIPDVSHVINYDAPHHAEDYVHRIGRTGRAGKSGEALTIVARADGKAIAEIEKLIARKIDWQEGAALPPDDEHEAPRRERSPRRGAARAPTHRPAPIDGAERAAQHPERRSDSRRHHAERPPRERAAAGAERRPGARVPAGADRAPREKRPPRENEAPVVGLGDHVPDFLLRSVKARPKAAREPVEAEE